jgi:hypothetical protein
MFTSKERKRPVTSDVLFSHGRVASARIHSIVPGVFLENSALTELFKKFVSSFFYI